MVVAETPHKPVQCTGYNVFSVVTCTRMSESLNPLPTLLTKPILLKNMLFGIKAKSRQ